MAPIASDNSATQPGITFRSLMVTVFGLVIMAMHIQYVEVILADQSALAEQALPISALSVFVLLLLVSGGLYTLLRRRLVTRPELFCALLAMLIATPIMTQGMWHRFLGLIAATPRGQDFPYIDALSDKLWPHGDNLLAGELREDSPRFQVRGNAPRWEDVGATARTKSRALVFENRREGDLSAVVFELPVGNHDPRGLVPGEPHLVTMLVHSEGFAVKSLAFCRAYWPNSERYQELINNNETPQVTFLHQDGFVRVGAYGVSIDPGTNATVLVAFGLQGPGKLAIRDPKLFSVAALEWAYLGRQIVSETEYARLTPAEQVGVIVKPDRLLSLAGLRYIITGYIPLRAWWRPAVAWSSLVAFLLAATLALAVFMRRLWAEEQRYPFPVFQIPWRLLGGDEDETTRALPVIWRTWTMWCGFGLSLAWALVRGWHFYNPSVPDLSINVALGDYISDPDWGGMWGLTFTVSASLLSLALFMELNVLLSFLIGLLIYRLTLWLGQTTGWNASYGYPFRYEQAIGAYLAYAAIVVLVSGRYLRSIGRAIRHGEWEGNIREALSPRLALGVLLASFVAAAGWARWLEVSPTGIVLFLAFLVLVGFVAAKLRAECGIPYGYFTPYNAMLFVGLVGGMPFFGAEAMMVCLIASGFLTVSVFFYIPGLQVELLEFGRRVGVRPRHLVYTCVVGVLAGLFIGGWVFLSNAYAIGGDGIKYQWAFNQGWFFGGFRAELTKATAELVGQQAGTSADTGLSLTTVAYLFGALGTVVLTAVRQFVPGFWFHPIGFILGSSHLVEGVWGSLAVAWVIKSISLKVGGAEFYRRKLVPFAVGIFLGALLSVVVFNVQAAILHSRGIENTYGNMP